MTSPGVNRRALVVDDSRVIRAIVGKSLQGLGFEVEHAGHGVEALQKLEGTKPPALLMIDWNMPEMSGITLVQSIRSRPEWRDIKLIMITSENEGDRVQEALTAGADEYIMKPFTQEMILEKLMLLGVALPDAAGT